MDQAPPYLLISSSQPSDDYIVMEHCPEIKRGCVLEVGFLGQVEMMRVESFSHHGYYSTEPRVKRGSAGTSPLYFSAGAKIKVYPPFAFPGDEYYDEDDEFNNVMREVL